MKTSLDESASSFLIQASLLYKDKCPELSRHLLQGPIEANGPSRKSSPSVCSFCYQWLQPDNHRVRVCPKRRPSAQVQSVLRRQVQGKNLSLMQKDLLQQFYKSSSVLMVTCHTCDRTSSYKGMSREFIMSRSHGTPGSGGKHKTPQSGSRSNKTTPRTGGKDKTPVHTPRASISSTTPGSGSTSCKSAAAKGKNWVVQRLSKMLMREDNPGKKKGGLKDFLSSL